MKKVVVTTDFSENSKKGILFALQMAKQTDCELIFYNVVQIFRPSIWDNVYYGQFESDEVTRSQHTLESFIKSIVLKSNMDDSPYSCVCEVGMSASNAVIEFATKVCADYICTSTAGVGKFMKLFGTTASELITFSPTPVIIIPKNYKSKPISNIFFASDFKNFSDELHHLQKFSAETTAKINVYHYDFQLFLDVSVSKFERIAKNNKGDNIKFNYRKLDDNKSLLSHLEMDIAKAKPSIVVLFTKQNRNWFSRLILSSLSAELSFDTKTPLLIFRKKEK